MDSKSPIVVGIDFSEGASVALAEARKLARQLGARLDVVHVVDGYVSGDWQPDAEAEAWLEAESVGRSELVVRPGLPWVQVVRYAFEVAASMVVVGSHGASGFQPLALGSTAARLVIRSPYPVLVVTPRAERENTTGPEAMAAS